MFVFDIWSLSSFFFSRTCFFCLLSSSFKPLLKLKKKKKCLQHFCLYNSMPHSVSTYLVAQLVKKPPAVRETWVWSLGWEDPLKKAKTTYSSILAWRIPWTLWVAKSQTPLRDLHFLFQLKQLKSNLVNVSSR